MQVVDMDKVPFREDDEPQDLEKTGEEQPDEDEDLHLWQQDWSDPHSIPGECAVHLREDHSV